VFRRFESKILYLIPCTLSVGPMQNPFESHPRIFVVDDELSIAKMLAVILQIHLFDAVPFVDPEAALEAARTVPPDYLISDIQMQAISGIDLAILFAQEFPACKVLLFSGQTDAPERVQKASEDGHTFSFLQKPLHPNELVAALKQL
jgi:DNA-binding NtrC family response regulator